MACHQAEQELLNRAGIVSRNTPRHAEARRPQRIGCRRPVVAPHLCMDLRSSREMRVLLGFSERNEYP